MNAMDELAGMRSLYNVLKSAPRDRRQRMCDWVMSRLREEDGALREIVDPLNVKLLTKRTAAFPETKDI